MESVTVQQMAEGVVRVDVKGVLGNEFPYATGYVMYGNGDISVENQIMPNDNYDVIPLVGTRMKIPAKYNNVTFFGKDLTRTILIETQEHSREFMRQQ